MHINDKYFAADDSDKCVEHLIGKSSEWFQNLILNRYLDKIQKSWLSYHGVYYEDSHSISYGGEQGELVNIAINHYRNLAKHMLVMVTASRPSFKCRAVNIDRKSTIQAKLGNSLLDYYMREKRVERDLKRAVEYAIVLGSGFVKLEWNSTKGKIIEQIDPSEEDVAEVLDDRTMLDENGNELRPIPVYEGDIESSCLSPFDVVFDSTKENPDLHDWVLCRTFVNKFDLIAKYPQYRDEILALETKDQNISKRISLSKYDSTNDVPVYEFFHKRTESVPNGRYLMYLSSDITLEDIDMPYRRLPVFRIAPSDILGTPYGYTEMWDIMPIQDALNSTMSTAMTNHNAFGVQNVLNPQGNNIKVNQLEGGLNFIEYNAQAGKPEALQLTQSSPESYRLMELLERSMETVSGINSVARGTPEPSLKSGTALAMVHAQALQFISGLQQSYILLLEDVGTGIINLLKDFASAPRIADIAGIQNTSKLKTFKSDDLKSINRVVVDVGNALMNSAAGRAQVAENLLQMGVITTLEQYIMVISTGNLEHMTDGIMNEMDTIKAENEALILGDEVIALATDHHSKHIREHRDVLGNYELRKDAELVQRTLEHIQEHINLLQTTDSNLLAVIGEQPLGPAQGSPVSPENAAPQQMPANAPGVAELQNNPQAQSLAIQDQNIPLPDTPNPPGQFADMPMTPEENMAKNNQG